MFAFVQKFLMKAALMKKAQERNQDLKSPVMKMRRKVNIFLILGFAASMNCFR